MVLSYGCGGSSRWLLLVGAGGTMVLMAFLTKRVSLALFVTAFIVGTHHESQWGSTSEHVLASLMVLPLYHSQRPASAFGAVNHPTRRTQLPQRLTLYISHHSQHRYVIT